MDYCIWCNTNATSSFLQIVGFFLALAAVSYSTMSLGSSGLWDSSQHEERLPYRPDFFHLSYALASMYMAMLYTNWSVSGNTEKFELDQGWVSFWVKMGSKWFCELLYVWTVVAPAIFRNREFPGS
jgi:hypothetical protein